MMQVVAASSPRLAKMGRSDWLKTTGSRPFPVISLVIKECVAVVMKIGFSRSCVKDSDGQILARCLKMSAAAFCIYRIANLLSDLKSSLM
jgi:hypothetical protein